MLLFLEHTMFGLDNRGQVTKEMIGPQSIPVVFTTLSLKKKIASGLEIKKIVRSPFGD